MSSVARVQEFCSGSWTRGGCGGGEWEPCMQNTAHCVKVEEFFSPEQARSQLAFCCLPVTRVGPPQAKPPPTHTLKYSEEQMVLKHDRSPSHTRRPENSAHSLQTQPRRRANVQSHGLLPKAPRRAPAGGKDPHFSSSDAIKPLPLTVDALKYSMR